jgi:hypothetical protein
MELITPELKSDAKRVFGTAIGISGADLEIVNADIHQMLHQKPSTLEMNINNSLDCVNLFTHYWRKLSRG